MATTSNNKWGKVLASYDAMIEMVWDLAFGGEMSDSESAASDIIVQDYNKFKAYLEANSLSNAEG